MPKNPNRPQGPGCGPVHSHTSASENIKLQMMMSKLEDSLKDEFILKEDLKLKTINLESLLGEGNIEINCVKEIKKTATNDLIDTYIIYFNNGENFSFTVTNGKDGDVGPEGPQGNTGLGIKETKIVDGNLIITYTDDTSISLGRVVGANGADGKNGTNGQDGQDGKDGIGINGANIDQAGNLVLVLSNNTSIIVGKVVGNDGTNGSNGKSAFDLAKENGFSGTLTEWLNSLKGEKGTDGTGISLKATKEDCVAVGDAYIINDPKDGDYGHIYILTDLEPRNFEDGGEIKGPKGDAGTDGREIELQVSEQAIQWRYKETGTWVNLISLDSLKGKDGLDGKNGQDGINGTNGLDGKDGADGEDGKDGREVKLQVTDTAIQWCYDEQNPTWINLINLDQLRGTDGTDGIDGRPVEFQISNGYVQWRIVGDTTWQNLVSTDSLKLTYNDLTETQKAELKGEKGARGYGITGVHLDLYNSNEEKRTYILDFEDPSVEDRTFEVYNGARGPRGYGVSQIKDVTLDDTLGYKTYRIILENGEYFEYSLNQGKNGTDGYTPQKGVDYFDGKDGKDGKDGISPILRILDDIWEVSYDNGLTFTSTGVTAIGKDGAKGDKGVGIKNIQHDRNDENGNCIYVITLTDDRTEEFTVYKGAKGTDGKDGLTTAVKINGTTYVHNNGTIELPDLLTAANLLGYATENYVLAEIAKAKLEGEDVDLSGLATKDELNTKADKEHTHEQYLTEHQDISGKQDIITDLAEIRAGAVLGKTALQSIPAEYVTETELNAKGYLIAQDLADKADKTELVGLASEEWVRSELAKIDPTIPSEYITETELESKGYITVDAIAGKADKSELNSLATKQELQDAINGIDIPEPDLSNYYTIAEVNTKITGLASESYVDDKIAEIEVPDVTSFITIDDVDDKLGEFDNHLGSTYATKAELNTHIINTSNPHGVTAEQVGAYSKEDTFTKEETREYVGANVADAVAGLASTEYVDNAVANITAPPVDLSEYAKKSEIPSLDGFATEAWVNEQNYLTEHQSLADYYTKEEAHTKFLSKDEAGAVSQIQIGDTVISPNGAGIIDISTELTYAIQNEIGEYDTQVSTTLANYATKQYVDNAIDNAITPDNLPDILPSVLPTTTPFTEDKYVTNPIGDFKVGDSIKGLTVAEIFAKLLGLVDEPVTPDEPENPENPQTPEEILEYLTDKKASIYIYDDTDTLVQEPFTEPTAWTPSEASVRMDGVSTKYLIKDGDTVVEAGYQQATTYSDTYWLTVALPSEINNIKVKLYDPDVPGWIEQNWHMVPANEQTIDGYTIWTVPEEFEIDAGATYRFVIIN